jgi:O-antigen/teichoic acid export membrane protein
VIERLRRNVLFRHAALVFGGVVVANVCNYLYYMLVGRAAGVVVYGEVTSLASALLVLGAPANVGQLIVAKLAADLDAVGDRAALRRLSDMVTRWTLVAGVLAVVAAVLLRGPIAGFFNLDDPVPIVATALALAAFFVTYVQRGVLQGAHLFEEFSMSLVIEAVARVVLGVVFVLRWGATGALIGSAIGIALAAIYNTIVFGRRFGRLRAPVLVDRSTLARIVTGVGLGQVTLTVLTFYDVPLIKHAFDARSAGLYAAAALVGRAVLAAAAFIPTIVLPKATARVAAGLSPLPLFVAAVGMAFAFAAFAALCSSIAPAFVVTTIAGRAFRDAAPLVLLYVFASGALSIATVVASYNFGLHRYAFVIPMSVAACAEIVTLSLWHPSLIAFVEVLLVGHTCVLLASLYRVTAPAARPEAIETGDPIPAAEPTIG